MKSIESFEDQQFEEWLREVTDGVHVSGSAGGAALEASLCANIALEHYRAIIVCTNLGYIATAVAITRMQFEAVVRGLWILTPSDSGADLAEARCKSRRPLKGMIADIKKPDPFTWSLLHDAHKHLPDEFVHSKSEATQMWISDLHSPDLERRATLRGLAQRTAVLAAALFATIAERPDVVAALVSRFQVDP